MRAQMVTLNGNRGTDPPVLSLPRDRRLALGGSPLVMGVLNVTPDSFSDGGRWFEPDSAVEHGLELFSQGADLLDIGAESTRPGGGVYGDGARTVSPAEECDRLLPVIEGLRRETDRPLSIDTRKSGVARQALAAGGDLINDVSGLADPETASVAAEAGAPLIVMHSRGELVTMQKGIRFRDLLAEVGEELLATARRAHERGIPTHGLLVDPGLGFGKTSAHNVDLLARLDVLAGLGYPLVVGASRKSFIGTLTGAAVGDRLPGSLAAAAAAAAHGAAVLRVHDVAETVQFLAVWRAVFEARASSGKAA